MAHHPCVGHRGILRRSALAGLAGMAMAPAIGAPPARAQAAGGTLVIGQTSDAASLDPAFSIDSSTGNVLRHIYETVLTRHADGSIGPGAAARADNLGPTEWRVTMRDGGRFSNGEPADAEAVRFSLDRLTDPATKAPQRSLYDKIKSARVESPTTLVFATDGPDALFEARMCNLMLVPPKHTAEVGARLTETPIGSGPYVLESWRRNDAVVLNAVPNYRGAAAKFGKLVFRDIPEEIARISAVKTGEAQIVTGISPSQADSLSRAGGVQVLKADSTRVMVLEFNAALEPANDVRFRRAVAHAINRDEIIKGLMKGYATPVDTIFASVIQGVPKGANGAFPYDPDLARKLIEELGLKGHEIELGGGAGHFPLDREIALVVGAQLRRVGLEVKVRPEEYGTFLADVKNRKVAPVFIQPHGNVWLDPVPQVVAFFYSKGFISAWRDPALDALIDQANAVLGAERVKLVGDIIARLHDEAICAPMFAYQFIYAAASGIKWQPRADEVISVSEIG